MCLCGHWASDGVMCSRPPTHGEPGVFRAAQGSRPCFPGALPWPTVVSPPSSPCKVLLISHVLYLTLQILRYSVTSFRTEPLRYLIRPSFTYAANYGPACPHVCRPDPYVKQPLRAARPHPTRVLYRTLGALIPHGPQEPTLCRPPWPVWLSLTAPPTTQAPGARGRGPSCKRSSL